MMWGGIAKDGWRLSEPYLRLLTFQAPTPQNGQTHSNNSLQFVGYCSVFTWYEVEAWLVMMTINNATIWVE